MRRKVVPLLKYLTLILTVTMLNAFAAQIAAQVAVQRQLLDQVADLKTKLRRAEWERDQYRNALHQKRMQVQALGQRIKELEMEALNESNG